MVFCDLNDVIINITIIYTSKTIKCLLFLLLFWGYDSNILRIVAEARLPLLEITGDSGRREMRKLALRQGYL